MMTHGHSRRAGTVAIALCVVIVAAIALPGARTERAAANHAPEFSPGDLFIYNQATVEWRHPWDGSVHEELPPPSSTFYDPTTISFDSAGNLYLPDGQNLIHRWDKTGFYLGTFGSSLKNPLSVAFDPDGYVYVGQGCHNACAPGSFGDDIVKLDPQGNEVDRFDVEDAHGGSHGRGASYVDLGPDHCTIYYAALSAQIKRYGICPGNRGQLPSFTESYHGSFNHFRVTPAAEILAPDGNHIHLFGADGQIKQTWDHDDIEVPPSCYTAAPTTTTTSSTTSTTLPVTTLPTVPTPTPSTTAPSTPCVRGGTGRNSWAGVNLDPDGTSFWAAEEWGNVIHRFEFGSATGLSKFSFKRETGSAAPRGLGVFAEIRAGAAPTVGISDAEVVEPPTGSRTMSFTVSLTSPVDVDVPVQYFTGDGPDDGGARSDIDFRRVDGGSVTIPAGALQVAATVEVLADDDAGEPTETFVVNMTEDSDAVGNRKPRGTGTIYDIAPRRGGTGGTGDSEVDVDDDGPSGAEQDPGNRGQTIPGSGNGPPPPVNPGPGTNLNPSLGPSAPQAPAANAPAPQPQPIVQVQPVAQVQGQVQAQVQQAVQAQPAMMLERQREAQVQTAGLDGRAGEPWLATARPSPVLVVGWASAVLGLAVAMAWGVGTHGLARTAASTTSSPRRRRPGHQSPRHHREWAQRPW